MTEPESNLPESSERLGAGRFKKKDSIAWQLAQLAAARFRLLSLCSG
jgi:hypothetical protein